MEIINKIVYVWNKISIALFIDFFIKDNKKQGINNTLFSYSGANEVVIYNFFGSLDDWYKYQSIY